MIDDELELDPESQPSYNWQPPPKEEPVHQPGWVIADLSRRPDMIEKWKHLAEHGKTTQSREMAQQVIRQLEDYLGETV